MLKTVGEENLFLCPLRFCVWEPVNVHRNTHLLIFYFTCTGIHRKEVKLKGGVRIGSFCNILTHKRGFGFQGTVNCGEVTRKYMGELVEDTGYFSKVCLCRVILVGFDSLS